MNQERIFQVLQGPHISEKAAIVADANNQYVFKVAVDATKAEIKKSVEQLFKVKVKILCMSVVTVVRHLDDCRSILQQVPGENTTQSKWVSAIAFQILTGRLRFQ